jgi:hypothetical protein
MKISSGTKRRKRSNQMKLSGAVREGSSSSALVIIESRRTRCGSSVDFDAETSIWKRLHVSNEMFAKCRRLNPLEAKDNEGFLLRTEEEEAQYKTLIDPGYMSRPNNGWYSWTGEILLSD